VRPLLDNPKRKNEAARFHREVFALYGGPKRLCVFCGRQGATDAAHVISRSKLGPLRYADPRFARPAHRRCHMEQEAGLIDFAIEIQRDAIAAHNEISKIKLVMP
jgi:hypothetical protein